MLAARTAQDEAISGEPGYAESIQPQALLERVLERANRKQRIKTSTPEQRRCLSIDGMTVDELPEYLRHHWPRLRAQLIDGTYKPQPVRRVDIPKPDGKTRPLGIPTVLDRFIQQAIAQIISAQWEPHFHPHSYGFRPQRSAHQAVRHVQASIREGHGWVVDMDLQAFFDRVNHDRLMVRLKSRCHDHDLLRLINRYRKRRCPRGGSYRGNIDGRTARRAALPGVGQRRAG